MISLPNPYSVVGPVKCPSSMSNTQTMIEFPTLQSKDGTMVVGFYPIEDCSNYTLKVLSWKGIDTISQKCITKRDAIREINERIALDYEITGDNIDLIQDYNFMQGAV